MTAGPSGSVSADEARNGRAGGSGAAGGRPLLRLLWLAGPLRGRLALSVLAGAAATGFGVALLATSGFMLARASEHPGILAISVAVVAVRAFSVGRGVSRYLERLTSHDVAFRVLADIRVAIYRRLERLAPAGLAAFRSGDLLAALISDVDATQDLFIRGVGPPLAAALVGAGAVTVCLVILAPAGALLALGLLAAGLAAPPLAVAASRRAARATASARGELSATVTDLLSGAAELHAFGAQDTALAAAAEADAKLTALTRRSAAAMGLGSGLVTGLTGLTVWGVLVLGVAAVGQGTLTRVPLAVLALTALAAFEAVTVMPAAALQLGSRARVGPPHRHDPGRAGPGDRADRPPAAARRAGSTYGCRGCRSVTSQMGHSRWTDSIWTSPRAAGSRSSAPAGPASPPRPLSCCVSATRPAARSR